MSARRLPGEGLSQLRSGQRVAIHPAEDIWMRGVCFAIIISVGRKWIHLHADHPTTNVRFKLPIARHVDLPSRVPGIEKVLGE
jgi:hypothetical protein